MSDTMDSVLTLLGGIAGGSSLSAAFGYLRSRRQSEARERIATTIGDERTTPPLLERIATLEERIDQRDRAIDDLQAQRHKFATAYEECERRAAQQAEALAAQAELLVTLGNRIEELEQALSERDADLALRVRRAVDETMRATPPGGWSAAGPIADPG